MNLVEIAQAYILLKPIFEKYPEESEFMIQGIRIFRDGSFARLCSCGCHNWLHANANGESLL